ncbi:zinc-binding protein A33 isoform X1 [Brienomyrus brachyistius]|uniref:zinc-binding protein A33 isoform X1 n=1 Tax=Brienomyrus brachyistius TaxID=42636 RepID=UPI0020B1C974|nr:zinc-binding protein A33 isoform X1 [Brienomyrus brachyistius]
MILILTWNFSVFLFQQKLIQAIKRIKHEIDECWDAERETYAQALSVENTFDDLEREIRSEYRNLHRFLDLEEEMDIERLTKEKEKRVKLLREREKKISEQGKDLERAIETLNSKLKEEDSAKLLNDIKDLLKRCQVNFVPPSAVNAEIQAGQFIGPLQYKIWKHMKSSLYPNIATFTFDADTAHPLLRLSPCSTSVWFEDKEDTPPEPESDNPRRFHYYYCLLGQEGFTHGRHYWEVEVGLKTAWRVGVAREDVYRGEMDSCTTANGLWTLALKGGIIQACTEPCPTPVKAAVRPTRIGVFLDCEREEVSFYNAITMTSLFSFSMGTIFQPIFPFFNPCDTDEGKNTAPLTLFSPSL